MKRLASLLAAAFWVAAEAGLAHPLGNSTVNRWAQLEVSGSGIEVDYVLDLAELPTLVESGAADRDGDGQVSDREWSAYTRAWAQRLSGELHVTLDGQRLALQPGRADFVTRDGEAGLNIVRLEASLRADFPDGARGKTVVLGYRDATRASALGWKEVSCALPKARRCARAPCPVRTEASACRPTLRRPAVTTRTSPLDKRGSPWSHQLDGLLARPRRLGSNLARSDPAPSKLPACLS